MELTEEALALLIETAQKAKTPQGINTQNPRKIAFALNGDVDTMVVPPDVRRSRVHSLDDLIQAAEQAWATDPVIWHDRCSVVVVLDNGDRRDTVVFELIQSRPFLLLDCHSREIRQLDQRKFCRLLRYDLMVDAALVAPFRRLEWVTGSKSLGETKPSHDRLGKEITASVTGTDELPEEITVNVPVYENVGERGPVSIVCSIETQPENNTIVLRPMPLEMQTAVDEVQQRIHDRLVLAVKCPVFYGCP